MWHYNSKSHVWQIIYNCIKHAEAISAKGAQRRLTSGLYLYVTHFRVRRSLNIQQRSCYRVFGRVRVLHAGRCKPRDISTEQVCVRRRVISATPSPFNSASTRLLGDWQFGVRRIYRAERWPSRLSGRIALAKLLDRRRWRTGWPFPVLGRIAADVTALKLRHIDPRRLTVHAVVWLSIKTKRN